MTCCRRLQLNAKEAVSCICKYMLYLNCLSCYALFKLSFTTKKSPPNTCGWCCGISSLYHHLSQTHHLLNHSWTASMRETDPLRLHHPHISPPTRCTSHWSTHYPAGGHILPPAYQPGRLEEDNRSFQHTRLVGSRERITLQPTSQGGWRK